MYSTRSCNNMDVVVKKENDEESIITIENFPFICRICCQRRDDLRLFEEERDLFDLFHTIRKTDVQSTTMFPRNVCDECVNKLEDISGLIQTFKCTDIKPETNLTLKKEIECGKASEAGEGTIKETTKQAGEDISLTSCRICSSPSHLRRLVRQRHLLQLFQNITNVYVKGENCHASEYVFCKSCIDKLKDISSFINSSLSNDMKIEYAVGKCEFVKTENCSDATDDYAPTETADDKEMIMSEITKEEVTVDIKVEVSDYELDATTSQKCLSYNSGGEERHYRCDCCEESFALKDDLQQHMLTHTEEKHFKCDLCEESYTLKDHLEKHLQDHASSSHPLIKKEDKRVKCEHCGKILLEYFLDNHMRRHMLNCRFCGETFAEKSNFEEHLRTHAGEKAYKCNLCEKSFHLPSSLRRHLLIHSEERPYKCHLCTSTFKQDTYLHRHLVIHAKEKRYKCDSCGESFTQPSYLQKHMLIHSGEKLYTCKECGKNFRRASCLQRHLLTHTEEKLYTCNECGKTFKLLSYLQRHLLTHPGGQEYHCDKCEKVYTQESRFKWHMWTHRSGKQMGV